MNWMALFMCVLTFKDLSILRARVGVMINTNKLNVDDIIM